MFLENQNHVNVTSPLHLQAPIGHVLTGDLHIVSNPKLKNLLKKGLKFREPNNFNWVTALKMCKEGLGKYKIARSRRENVSTSVFSDWENAVLKKINDRISRLSKLYTKSSVATKTLTCPKI